MKNEIISIVLNKELKDKLVSAAKIEDRTLSSYVRRLIEKELSKQEVQLNKDKD